MVNYRETSYFLDNHWLTKCCNCHRPSSSVGKETDKGVFPKAIIANVVCYLSQRHRLIPIVEYQSASFYIFQCFPNSVLGNPRGARFVLFPSATQLILK